MSAGNYYVMFEGESLTVHVPGILGNDNNLGGNSLTATFVSVAANGTLLLNQDGSISDMPNANFTGTDSFSYKVSDASVDSNVAMVLISVNPASGL